MGSDSKDSNFFQNQAGDVTPSDKTLLPASKDNKKNNNAYQVFARKYRPYSFDDLIGQDVIVRTFKNAFATNRIAQAFLLTGIRGTGKTTTARIIAKGLNCIGADGKGMVTTAPCGQCEPCEAITNGHHVDVIEMDAASRTGVDSIREIIDSVYYRAASARYKIYIIDEVHMLSNSAFNALLKTLEEPPAHVKFIFATTEIRKVPVTVLSRCQRFDLRRIEPEDMMMLLKKIVLAENADISDQGLALIVKASEGSARDAISILDQALSYQSETNDANAIRDMLGLADKGRIFDLFDFILQGDGAGALKAFGNLYTDGAYPEAILRDLAELTHWISIIKFTPDAVNDPTISPEERIRGQEMADRLMMRVLTRFWQMLLKALEEVAMAPNPMMAAEMAIIRLMHVSTLPSPDELIRDLQKGTTISQPPLQEQADASQNGDIQERQPYLTNVSALVENADTQTIQGVYSDDGHENAVMDSRSEASLLRDQTTDMPKIHDAFAEYPDFDTVIELVKKNRDIELLIDIEDGLKLVRYRPGLIEFEPTENAPKNLAQRLAINLKKWTGTQWSVLVVNMGGQETIAKKRAQEAALRKEQVLNHPVLQTLKMHFPQAKIVDLKTTKK